MLLVAEAVGAALEALAVDVALVPGLVDAPVAPPVARGDPDVIGNLETAKLVSGDLVGGVGLVGEVGVELLLRVKVQIVLQGRDGSFTLQITRRVDSGRNTVDSSLIFLD